MLPSAPLGSTTAELRSDIDAWSKLPKEVRAGILAMVDAEGLGGRSGNSEVLNTLLEWLQGAARFLSAGSPVARLRGFVNGLVDTFNIVYFVSFTIVFLVAATKCLSLRRCP